MILIVISFKHKVIHNMEMSQGKFSVRYLGYVLSWKNDLLCVVCLSDNHWIRKEKLWNRGRQGVRRLLEK